MKKCSRIFCTLVSSIVGFSLVSSPSIAMNNPKSAVIIDKPKGFSNRDLLVASSLSITEDIYSIVKILNDLEKEGKHFPKDIEQISEETIGEISDTLSDIEKKFELMNFDTIFAVSTSEVSTADCLLIFTKFVECSDSISFISECFGNKHEFAEILSNIKKNIEKILNNDKIKNTAKDKKNSELLNMFLNFVE